MLTGPRTEQLQKGGAGFDNTEAASMACVYVDANGLYEPNNHQYGGRRGYQTAAHILLGHLTRKRFSGLWDEFVVLLQEHDIP